MKRSAFSGAGAAKAILLVLLLVLLVGCPKKPPVTELPGPKASPRFLGAGQSAKVEFSTDGAWHASGFSARPGDRLVFRPVGETRSLGVKAVQVHIGRTVTQLAFSPFAQVVTRPGQIAFRAVPEEVGTGIGPSAQVEIVNLRKDAE